MRSPTIVRQVALIVIVAIATLAVLLGVRAAFGSPSDAGVPTPTPVAAASASPTGAPTTEATPAPTIDRSSPSPSVAPSPSDGPSPDDPVFVGAGDIARCDLEGDEATAALLDDIPGTVFTVGDNAYGSGSPKQYAECYDPTWGRHFDRTWPAPGNHDWDAKDLAGYRGYFGAAAGTDDASWYARDLGAWRVIVLDSECDEVGGCDAESPQGRWLADELATHRPTCTVAIMHLARFSSGATHGDQPEVAPFWEALYAAGADVIIAAHDHLYERFAPQDPDGREDRARGIREFVVGTGGAPLYDFAEPRPNSELRASLAYGVLALTLHPTSYDWRFIAADSDFADAGSAGCH